MLFQSVTLTRIESRARFRLRSYVHCSLLLNHLVHLFHLHFHDPIPHGLFLCISLNFICCTITCVVARIYHYQVENLFNIGSPLAVFLALRGIRPQDDVEDHVLPKSVCKRMFNIYHPADPVVRKAHSLLYAAHKFLSRL